MWNSKSFILVCEDDSNDAHLLERAVKKIGVPNPIQVVVDGEEAIDYLSGKGKFADRVRHPFPSVIITDLKMPRKDGFDVLRWLQEHPECAVIPTIVWTSSAVDRDILNAYKLGANCYLQKPNNPGDWEKTIRLLFTFWTACEKPNLALSHCADGNPPETKAPE
jgi:CheY-like chemotaxis protein